MREVRQVSAQSTQNQNVSRKNVRNRGHGMAYHNLANMFAEMGRIRKERRPLWIANHRGSLVLRLADLADLLLSMAFASWCFCTFARRAKTGEGEEAGYCKSIIMETRWVSSCNITVDPHG